MFFPEAMTETEFIIPEKDLLSVTKVLAGQGIFHQVEASYMSSSLHRMLMRLLKKATAR